VVPELTAVVFSYNRRDVIETTLRSARFADRLVVVDKGSTDGSAEIGKAYADEFYTAAWSPTIEPTKAEYIPKIQSEWILVLDDDECLNIEAIAYIQLAVRKRQFDVYYLPLRNYILGRHDERAYYWPEHHPMLFRHGAVRFEKKVHGGKIRVSDNHFFVRPESGVSVLHLSHPDARTWIEKTNRYTDERDRASSVGVDDLTPAGVIRAMDSWLSKVPSGEDPYLTAVAALRGIYDVVDMVKLWEQQQEDGNQRFALLCEELNRDYDALGIGRRCVTVG
jgi:O-antigen biosynthesis protein